MSEIDTIWIYNRFILYDILLCGQCHCIVISSNILHFPWSILQGVSANWIILIPILYFYLICFINFIFTFSFQEQLGDIVYVQLPEIGLELEEGGMNSLLHVY